jgi:4-hydroxybenzoate polyprenyltransferase
MTAPVLATPPIAAPAEAAAMVPAPPAGAVLLALLAAARPRQWMKNAFGLAPLIFSGEFRDAGSVIVAVTAAFAFTLMAAGTYFLNDLADRDHDREHPKKRARPIASGRVSTALAAGTASALATGGLALGLAINATTMVILGAYWMLQLVYTTRFKKEAILDVLCIAMGFVFRVLAGAAAIQVDPSSWMVICTLFLATFLGFGKRAGEVVRLAGGDGGVTRPVLIAYHDRLLTSLLSITCSLTLMSYSLYTVTHAPSSPLLAATVPVVAYALFRYLLLALRASEGQEAENPETLLLRDRNLIIAGLAWGALSIAAIALQG